MTRIDEQEVDAAARTGLSTLQIIQLAARQRADMKRLFAKFLADEAGATAIEYGLIAAGISLAIVAVVNGLGTNLNTVFTSINTSLK